MPWKLAFINAIPETVLFPPSGFCRIEWKDLDRHVSRDVLLGVSFLCSFSLFENKNSLFEIRFVMLNKN